MPNAADAAHHPTVVAVGFADLVCELSGLIRSDLKIALESLTL